MKISTRSVLEKEQERKARPVPLPTISINGKSIKPVAVGDETEPEKVNLFDKAVTLVPDDFKANCAVQISEINDLHAEFGKLKRQRGKLSTQTAYLVQKVEAKLRAESPAIAAEFLKGNLPHEEIKEQYEKIDALTQQATRLWDRIQNHEKYGSAAVPGLSQPIEQVVNDNSAEIEALTKEIRRLDDLIHKTQKKLATIQSGLKPKTHAGEWIVGYKDKIAQADALREDLKKKRKRLQNEAREGRA